MKIAILVPSRERMNRRLTMLMSILTSVDDIDNVRVYFGVDDDDPTLPLIRKIVRAIPCVTIVRIHNDGKFIGLGKMWNLCVDASDEEIISMIGDDMVFATPGWDTKLIEQFKQAPEDQIYGVHCNDGYHGEKLAVNFFCLRKYVDVMGGKFMREEFRINWIDSWLHQLFESMGRLNYRSDIMIEHRHWVIGKDKRDKVADRMAIADVDKISDKLWYTLTDERIRDVWKLEDHIKAKADWSKVDIEKATINHLR